MDISLFVKSVLSKNKTTLENFFCKEAVIRWHCTNERFSVQEYIKVNCEYPGEWDGEIERVEEAKNTIIVAVRVFRVDKNVSFHVVSFIKIKNDLITEMDEYWSDDGPIPEFRKSMNIGRPIV